MSNIILKKSAALLGIGIIFLTVGIAYGVLTGDKLFVIMSIIICAVNSYKVFELKRIEHNKEYDVISGECIETAYKFVGKYRIYKIKSDIGIIEISVPKHIKLKLNENYRLYFRKIYSETDLHAEWLKNKVLSDSFLGYECVQNEKVNEEREKI